MLIGKVTLGLLGCGVLKQMSSSLVSFSIKNICNSKKIIIFINQEFNSNIFF